MRGYEKYLTDSETIGVKKFIERVRQFVASHLLELYIFGSKVRGDFDKESDIDILLVIESDDWHIREEISNIAADINLEFDCNISPVIYTQREHEKNKYFQTLFIQEVEREGVSIDWKAPDRPRHLQDGESKGINKEWYGNDMNEYNIPSYRGEIRCLLTSFSYGLDKIESLK